MRREKEKIEARDSRRTPAWQVAGRTTRTEGVVHERRCGTSEEGAISQYRATSIYGRKAQGKARRLYYYLLVNGKIPSFLWMLCVAIEEKAFNHRSHDHRYPSQALVLHIINFVVSYINLE